jgi:hypothetical protein
MTPRFWVPIASRAYRKVPPPRPSPASGRGGLPCPVRAVWIILNPLQTLFVDIAASHSRSALPLPLAGETTSTPSPHHAGEKVGALLRPLIPKVFRPHFLGRACGGGSLLRGGSCLPAAALEMCASDRRVGGRRGAAPSPSGRARCRRVRARDGFSHASSMLAKKIVSGCRQPDHDVAAAARLAHRKSAIDRVLPHRQARAGGSPGIDHVGMRSRRPRNPFQ